MESATYTTVPIFDTLSGGGLALSFVQDKPRFQLAVYVPQDPDTVPQ